LLNLVVLVINDANFDQYRNVLEAPARGEGSR